MLKSVLMISTLLLGVLSADGETAAHEIAPDVSDRVESITETIAERVAERVAHLPQSPGLLELENDSADQAEIPLSEVRDVRSLDRDRIAELKRKAREQHMERRQSGESLVTPEHLEKARQMDIRYKMTMMKARNAGTLDDPKVQKKLQEMQAMAAQYRGKGTLKAAVQKMRADPSMVHDKMAVIQQKIAQQTDLLTTMKQKWKSLCGGDNAASDKCTSQKQKIQDTIQQLSSLKVSYKSASQKAATIRRR